MDPRPDELNLLPRQAVRCTPCGIDHPFRRHASLFDHSVDGSGMLGGGGVALERKWRDATRPVTRETTVLDDRLHVSCVRDRANSQGSRLANQAAAGGVLAHRHLVTIEERLEHFGQDVPTTPVATGDEQSTAVTERPPLIEDDGFRRAIRPEKCPDTLAEVLQDGECHASYQGGVCHLSAALTLVRVDSEHKHTLGSEALP